MKPIRLTMQAFGPFAGREVVDFRDALSAGLFGIYGQTGSGKSTIFSAICFALFGEAAKADQKAPSLRSDHAELNRPTEVEFIFELGGKLYYIRRRPEQDRPKQRGEGVTKSLHEAWLHDATGLNPNDINPQNPGKIIAEKKTGLVAEAVKNILGYDLNQFRQIVLLPQGKFETFLAANTKERMPILKELFDVSLYEKLTEKLKEDAKEAEKNIANERNFCEKRLKDEGFASMEEFASALERVAEELDNAKMLEKQTSDKAEAEQKAYNDALAIIKAFQDAQTAQEKLTALGAQKPEMDALETRLKEIGRAEKLLDVECEVTSAQTRLGERRVALAAKQTASQNADEAALKAAAAYQAAKTHEADIKALEIKIADYQRYQQELNQADTMQKIAKEAEKTFKSLETKRDNNAKKIEAFEIKAQEIAKRKDRLHELDKQQLAQQKQLSDKSTLHQAAMRYEKDASKIAATQKDAAKSQTALDEKISIRNTAQSDFNKAENALARAQAFHLAEKLEDGSPCPVCGSLDHPMLATGNGEHQGLDQAFRETRAALQQAQADEQNAKTDLEKHKAILADRQEEFAKLEKPENTAENLKQAIADLKTEQATLDSERQSLGDPEHDNEELAQERAKITTQQTKILTEFETARTEATKVQERYLAQLEKVPEDLRDKTGLGTKLEKSLKQLATWQTAITKAQEADTASHDAMLNAQKDVEAAEQNLKDAENHVAQTTERFQNRMAETGLTEEHYQALKPEIIQLEANRTKLSTYAGDLKTAETMLQEKQALLAGKSHPEIEQFETRKQEAENAKEAAIRHTATIASKRDGLEKLHKELEKTLAKLDADEKKTGPLRELAKLCDGNNERKLKLEIYAMGAIFAEVLQAANLRLDPMSRGRFAMELSEEEESGGGQRGLGIRIMDFYTGKSRPISTLSGGESFIAALSLALGLADVVESNNGKVKLDTIFIDEGFGSLDSEGGSGTLEDVLRALETLTSRRRAVGIISHVQLVQDAIPNGFYVKKDLKGSQIEKRDPH